MAKMRFKKLDGNPATVSLVAYEITTPAKAKQVQKTSPINTSAARLLTFHVREQAAWLHGQNSLVTFSQFSFPSQD